GGQPAADSGVVAVPEVAAGDRRAGADQVDHLLVEQPGRPAVDVALQVPADLIMVVAQAVRLVIMGRVEQQPGGLDRPGPDQELLRPDLGPPDTAVGILTDQGDCDHPAGAVGDQSLHRGPQQDRAVAGGDRRRDRGVVTAGLRLDRAGEPDAPGSAAAALTARVRAGDY